MTGGIDRVGGLVRPGAATPLGRSRAAGGAGGGFSISSGASPPPASSGIGASEAASLLGVMLALQEAGAERPRDRAARRHGEAMLVELRALQLALIEGGGGAAALERLAELAEHLPEAAHPGLQANLSWLALRARIELARRRRESLPEGAKTA